MTHVILMRHCEAASDADIADDHARALTPRGLRAATALGAWLRERPRFWPPDLTLCSSATRTRQTLDRLDSPPHGNVSYRSDLYLASEAALWRALREGALALPGEATIALIGHNPGIGSLVLRACQGAHAIPDLMDFPSGATAVVEFADLTTGQGRLVDFIVPALGD